MKPLSEFIKNFEERYHITINDVTKFLHAYNYHFAVNDKRNTFLGIPTEKNPLDAWVYQEIIFERKPSLIIECGSYKGGSAVYLKKLQEFAGGGRVITIENRDIIHPDAKKRSGITFILGDTRLVSEDVAKMIEEDDTVMVVMDSDHGAETIKKELELYSGFVTPGQFLIVEDAYQNHDVVFSVFEQFLAKNPEFKERQDMNKTFFTSNFNGYFEKS